jgi:ABC-2 type transport system ATP-binding protein/ribosome-dependent ATPase
MQEADQCDRLAIMVAGQVAATGTVTDIIGDRTAVQIDTDAWQQAFNTLADAGMPVLLSGRSVRVPDASAADVQRVLEAAGLSARITEVSSTLDETLVTLGRASSASDTAANGDPRDDNDAR